MKKGKKLGKKKRNWKDYTCDQCEHGCPIGEGDLFCDFHGIVKEDYVWNTCGAFK